MDPGIKAPAPVPAKQAEPNMEAAKYFSPVVRFDKDVHAAVLQYRDTDTGDVIRQFPTEQQVQVYAAGESAESSLQTSA